MWKCYVVLGVYLAGCIIIGLIIALLTPGQCISNNCKLKSNLIVSDIDSSVGPCDNFYKFVCGKYGGLHRNAKLDKGSVWEDIKEIQIRRLVDFLNKSPSKRDDRVLRVLKKVYKSCLDDAEIDRQGFQPILRLVQMAEGFPLLQGSRWDINPSGKERSWDDLEYSARFAGFTGGHLLDSYVALQQYHGKDSFYIHLTIPKNLELDLSNEKYLYSYIEKITEILNNTHSNKRTKEIKDTLKFRLDLEKTTIRETNCSYPTVIEKLSSFVKEFEFLGLKEFFQNMSPYVTMPTRIAVSFVCRRYLKALKNLFESYPQRVVANYLMIENIIEVTPMLPRSLRDPYVEYLNKTMDPNQNIESSKSTLCAKAIKSKMSSALSALYIREHYNTYQEPTFLVNTLVSIKTQVKRVISKLKWVSEKDKRKASAKIDEMRFASPVPRDVHKQLLNLTSFRVFYEDLCFTGNTTSSLAAFLILQQFKTDKNWELLERPSTVFDENVDIFSSEISYEKKRNTIVIPMGFVTYPTFDKLWPYYLNYGGFGVEIAKKMMEAVSPIIQSQSKYKSNADCFVDKYDKYMNTIMKVKVDDPACVKDNMAAVAGLQAAYKAYAYHQNQRFFPERHLIDLEHYTPNHMFFLDFATFFCRENKPFYKKGMSQGDLSEASNEYKVNGALRNFEPFTENFKCSKNTYMSPSDRCTMWDP